MKQIIYIGLILALFMLPFASAEVLKTEQQPIFCRLLLRVFQQDFRFQRINYITDFNDDNSIDLIDLVIFQQNQYDNRWCYTQFFPPLNVWVINSGS